MCLQCDMSADITMLENSVVEQSSSQTDSQPHDYKQVAPCYSLCFIVIFVVSVSERESLHVHVYSCMCGLRLDLSVSAMSVILAF